MRARRHVVLPLFLASACSFSLHQVSHWATASWCGDGPFTGTKTLRVECPAAANSVRICATTACTGGDLTLVLVDPAGVERHRETVRRGQREARTSWPAATGTWQLQVEASGFCGSWSTELGASDEPVVFRVEATAGR